MGGWICDIDLWVVASHVAHALVACSNVMELMTPSEHGKNMVESGRGGRPKPITTMGRQRSAARQMVAAQLAPPDATDHPDEAEQTVETEHRIHARAASLGLDTALSATNSNLSLESGAPVSDDRSQHTNPGTLPRGGSSGFPDLELRGPLGHAEMLISRKLYGVPQRPRAKVGPSGLGASIPEEDDAGTEPKNTLSNSNGSPSPAAVAAREAAEGDLQASPMAGFPHTSSGNGPSKTPFAAGAEFTDTATSINKPEPRQPKMPDATYGPPAPAQHWQPGEEQAAELERLCRFRVIDFGLADFKVLQPALGSPLQG